MPDAPKKEVGDKPRLSDLFERMATLTQLAGNIRDAIGDASFEDQCVFEIMEDIGQFRHAFSRGFKNSSSQRHYLNNLTTYENEHPFVEELCKILNTHRKAIQTLFELRDGGECYTDIYNWLGVNEGDLLITEESERPQIYADLNSSLSTLADALDSLVNNKGFQYIPDERKNKLKSRIEAI